MKAVTILACSKNLKGFNETMPTKTFLCKLQRNFKFNIKSKEFFEGLFNINTFIKLLFFRFYLQGKNSFHVYDGM